MQVTNGVVILDPEVQGWTPTNQGVVYTDGHGQRVHVPANVLFHLYEGLKWHMEHTQDFDFDWDDHVARTMNSLG